MKARHSTVERSWYSRFSILLMLLGTLGSSAPAAQAAIYRASPEDTGGTMGPEANGSLSFELGQGRSLGLTVWSKAPEAIASAVIMGGLVRSPSGSWIAIVLYPRHASRPAASVIRCGEKPTRALVNPR